MRRSGKVTGAVGVSARGLSVRSRHQKHGVRDRDEVTEGRRGQRVCGAAEERDEHWKGYSILPPFASSSEAAPEPDGVCLIVAWAEADNGGTHLEVFTVVAPTSEGFSTGSS